MPHSSVVVTAHRAVCFTDDRYINAFGLSQAANADSKGPGPAECARVTTGTTTSSTHSSASDDDAPEVRGSTLLAEAINGALRAKLTCQQAVDLVAAAAFNHAAPVVALLPKYLRPLLQTARIDEVRLHRSHPALLSRDAHRCHRGSTCTERMLPARALVLVVGHPQPRTTMHCCYA